MSSSFARRILSGVLVGSLLGLVALQCAAQQNSAGTALILRVFGQPDMRQTNYNEVASNRSFHPAGLAVDRSPDPAKPSRLYVLDSGNNRIMGFDSFGVCRGGARAGAACTETSACGAGATCQPRPSHSARFVLGQPDKAGHGACNGDNTRVTPATAGSLCLVPYPHQISPLEGPSGGQLALDASRNLYVVDTFNNRVLRYDNPFATDTQADWQWGQPNFRARLCNRGGPRGASTLCTGEWQPGRLYWKYFTSSIAVSPNGRTLWVADPGNRRVLRLEPGRADATLVLGQPSFDAEESGCEAPVSDGSRLCAPTGVAYDAASDTLYVLDGYVEGPLTSQGRVLVYRRPSVNGQAPSAIWLPPSGATFEWPRGLTLEPGGALWVSDTGNARGLRFVDGAVTHVVGDNDLIREDCHGNNPCHTHGTLGIDNDGAIYLSDLISQRVLKFAGPNPLGTGDAPTAPVATLFENPGGNAQISANRVGASGLANPGYVLFADNQMVVADRNRILFWNHYADGPLAGGPASGVLGQPSFRSQADSAVTGWWGFGGLAWDPLRKHLWATSVERLTKWHFPNGLVSRAPFAEQLHADKLPTAAGAALPCPNPCHLVHVMVDALKDQGWIADISNGRILRFVDFSLPSRRIDLVLGQGSVTQGACNRGAGVHAPVPNGFCEPSQVAMDAQGNLFVVDGTWECRDGNCRILQFDAARIPAPNGNLQTPDIPASRVFGTLNFTTRDCPAPFQRALCRPRWVSFHPVDGTMFVAGDAYDNGLDRRLAYWTATQREGDAAPLPSGFLKHRINQAGPMAFDRHGRMAILDHTWNRVVLFDGPPYPDRKR